MAPIKNPSSFYCKAWPLPPGKALVVQNGLKKSQNCLEVGRTTVKKSQKI